MKKIGFLFVTILMMMLFAMSASAATEGYYTYKVENGEATITDVDESISGDVVIPDTLGGYPVTNIGYEAFSDNENLVYVTIPSSIKNIENAAFCGCSNLISIAIPNSVVNIGDLAFSGCISLKSITVPGSIKEINYETFSGCTNLETVVIDEGVTIIGVQAFAECDNLKSIKIPTTITDVYFNAFMDSVNYTSPKKNVYISNMVSWCNIKFDGYASNPLFPNGYLYLNNELLTELKIPKEVEEIRTNVFVCCQSIESVEICQGVTTIGVGSFDNCKSLEKIEISNSVVNIGNRAFNACDKLADVYYTGFESQWNKIIIGDNNKCLTQAKIHCIHEHYYETQITKYSTHLEEGVQTFTCACGDSYTESIAKTTEHTYNVSDIVAPKCEDKGYTVYVCECGSSKKDNYTSATGHKYDGQICVKCGENCSCNCHKTGISNFFWKIANFFNKLFKIKGKQMCACGVAHF